MAGPLEYFTILANEWIKLIVAPLASPDLLWLLLPVYLNWIVNEYFQERKGTSLGNAIANGFTMFWVGSDFIRTIFREHLSKGQFPVYRIAVSAIILFYGALVMFSGIRGKKITHYIGRVREITYITAITIPIFYGLVRLTTETVISIFLFFPVFYVVTEAIDRLLPPPKAELEDSAQPVAPHEPYTEPAQPAQQAPAEPNAKKSLLGKLAFWRR